MGGPISVIIPTDYRSGEVSTWETPEPEVIACDHGKPEGATLCSACEDRFAAILDDIPGLLADLELALTKQTSFVPQGSPQKPKPDEAPMPFNLAASKVLGNLTRYLGGPPTMMARFLRLHWQDTLRRPDLETLASAISRTVVAAHKVIDRPPTLVYYGLCPKCHSEIHQERIVAGDGKRVECPCGYRDDLAKHQAAQLDLGEDQWLTVTELLRVLNDGGEKATRRDVDNLIYRQGLPRQKEPRPYWSRDEGRLVKHEVFTYRLGTVRTMLLAKRISRAA